MSHLVLLSQLVVTEMFKSKVVKRWSENYTYIVCHCMVLFRLGQFDGAILTYMYVAKIGAILTGAILTGYR